MDVGFTGTRYFMTARQLGTVRKLLADLPAGSKFHHGGCIGADEQSSHIAHELGLWIVRHPPIAQSPIAIAKLAFSCFDEDREPKPYLERNHDIVDETQFLIAAPQQPIEQLRSGTWATVRYARKKRRRIVIVLPNGIINE